MITSIRLHGFQSHVDTQFDLSPGLNIITGPSDAGKTAVIRALRWVALGEPSGDSFVNEAVGFAQVEIRTEQHSITKTRKGAKTSYDIDGCIYEKAEVPIEVTEILGIERVYFGDFETVLQVAFQLDAPFLLSESPSAGAKVLGKLAHAEVVDHALKASAETIYAARRDKAAAETQLAEITATLSQFEYTSLPEMGERLQQCEALLASMQRFREQVALLQQLQARFKDAGAKKRTAEEVLLRLSEVPQLQKRLSQTEKYTLRRDVLAKISLQHTQLQKNLAVCLALAEKTKDTQEAADLLNRVSEGIDTLRALRKVHAEYRNALTQRETLSERLEKLRDLSAAQDLLNRLTAHSDRKGALLTVKDRWDAANALSGKAVAAAKEATANLAGAECELTKAWEAESVCPLCEREVIR